VIGTTGISMDITDRKLAELTVQQAKQDLEYRVEERTAELQQTVSQLQQEIFDRKQTEKALNKEQDILKMALLLVMRTAF
jgi:two-component system, NtrC family, sensor kinase